MGLPATPPTPRPARLSSMRSSRRPPIRRFALSSSSSGTPSRSFPSSASIVSTAVYSFFGSTPAPMVNAPQSMNDVMLLCTSYASPRFLPHLHEQAAAHPVSQHHAKKVERVPVRVRQREAWQPDRGGGPAPCDGTRAPAGPRPARRKTAAIPAVRPEGQSLVSDSACRTTVSWSTEPAALITTLLRRVRAAVVLHHHLAAHGGDRLPRPAHVPTLGVVRPEQIVQHRLDPCRSGNR